MHAVRQREVNMKRWPWLVSFGIAWAALGPLVLSASGADRNLLRYDLTNCPPEARRGTPVQGDLVVCVAKPAGLNLPLKFTVDAFLMNPKNGAQLVRAKRDYTWENGEYLVRLPDDLALAPPMDAPESVVLQVDITRADNGPKLASPLFPQSTRHTYALAQTVEQPPAVRFSASASFADPGADLPGTIAVVLSSAKRSRLALTLAVVKTENGQDAGGSRISQTFAVAGFDRTNLWIDVADACDLKAPLTKGTYRVDLFMADLNSPAPAAGTPAKPADSFTLEVRGVEPAAAAVDPNAAYWEANSTPLSEDQKRRLDANMGR